MIVSVSMLLFFGQGVLVVQVFFPSAACKAWQDSVLSENRAAEDLSQEGLKEQWQQLVLINNHLKWIVWQENRKNNGSVFSHNIRDQRCLSICSNMAGQHQKRINCSSFIRQPKFICTLSVRMWLSKIS